jgi:hypothetical protein
MKAELILACEMFLVPSTILFAAIALASTEGLRAGISAIGAATSVAWFVQIWWWPDLNVIERGTALALALTFGAAWLVSLIAHLFFLQRQWQGGRGRTL